MAADLLGPAFNYLMSQQQGTQQNADLQNTQAATAAQSANTAINKQRADQEALTAKYMNTLLPMKVEAESAKNNLELQQTSMQLAMIPAQKLIMEHQLRDAERIGTSPDGKTGDDMTDAQIAQSRKDTKLRMAMTLDPRAQAELMNSQVRFESGLRSEGRKIQDDRVGVWQKSLATEPLQSLLNEAEAKPGDPSAQFIVKYAKQHPGATAEEISTALDRINMTPKERQELSLKYSEQDRKEKDFKANQSQRDRQQERDDKRLNWEVEKHDLDKQKVAEDKERTIHDKKYEVSRTESKKVLADYSKLNDDNGPRGIGTQTKALMNLQSIVGSTNITPDIVKHELEWNKDNNGGKVSANQIQLLVGLKAGLAGQFTSNGQKTVQGILDKRYTTGALKRGVELVDTWFFGDKAPEFQTQEDIDAFSNAISQIAKVNKDNVTREQIGKIGHLYKSPDITPTHKLSGSREILDDPSAQPGTKVFVAKGLMDELDKSNVNFTKEEAITIKDLRNPNNFNAMKYGSAAKELTNIYEKYKLSEEGSAAREATPPTSSQVSSGYGTGVSSGFVPAKVQKGRNGLQAGILNEERQTEERGLADAKDKLGKATDPEWKRELERKIRAHERNLRDMDRVMRNK